MNPATDAPPKPFQFTLRQVAAWTAVIALCLALIVQLHFLGVAICGLGIGGYAVYKRWKLDGVITAFILLTCVSVLVVPAVRTECGSRTSQCQFNLRCIGIALQTYHDTYGCFPPAYIADANGQPMHSWRVLLLPFLEYQPLYEKYDFNEPWNGPNNSKLATDVPLYYHCPTDLPNQRPRNPATSYLAVVGPNTAWPGDSSVSMRQIADGTNNTLLVVEVHGSGINWMDPRDLDVTQMVPMINYPTGLAIRSGHPPARNDSGGGFAHVLYCDGHMGKLSERTSPSTIRALLTIAGGEKVVPP